MPKKKFEIWPYLLLAPALLIMVGVVFVPVVRAVLMSFQFYDMRYPNKTQWIGLDNYIERFCNFNA